MTEDFITFELAKKLKEKGYTLDTAHHYDDNGGIVVSLVEFDERCVYPCPEIHQVLKWLREEKGIFVLVDIQVDLRWYYEAWHIKNRLLPFGDDKYNRYDDYEEAAIAGIEYVIDNLI